MHYDTGEHHHELPHDHHTTLKEVDELIDHVAHDLGHIYGDSPKTDVDHQIVWGGHHEKGDEHHAPHHSPIVGEYPRLTKHAGHDHKYMHLTRDHGVSHDTHHTHPDYYYQERHDFLV